MSREIKISLFWILSSLILGCVILFTGTATTLPGPDSKETIFSTTGELISMAHGVFRTDLFVGILESPMHDVADPLFTEAREGFVQILQNANDLQGSLIFESVKTLEHSWAQDELFVSKDNHHLLVIAETKKPVYESTESLKKLGNEIEVWKKKYPWVSLSYSSSGVVNNELFSLINYDLDTSLKYTVPITIAILIWTFGSIGASIIAAFVTALSLVSSLGIASLLSHLVHPISATAAQLVVLMVMAVGTDYALFYIVRFRQEIKNLVHVHEALLKTSETTGVAILWSGITVSASLIGLLLVNDPILTSMAAISIIAVVVTLLITLKVLPCLLVVFQKWIDWGAIRSFSDNRSISQSRWVIRSVHHPRKALVFSVMILISLGFFCFQMNLGSTMQPDLMPGVMQSSRVVHTLDKFFPKFAGTGFTVVLAAQDLGRKEESDQLQPFFDALQTEDRIRGPISVIWSPDKEVARYEFKIDGSSQQKENREIIKRLEEMIIPTYLEKHGIKGFLTGKLIFDFEQEDFHKRKIIVVMGSILGASLVFLMIAFESIVIPIKAFFLNILSTSAAFGVMVLLFQLYGWRFGVIESFVPSLLFSILFGLSMDYHLLLISRIQEYVRGGKDTRQAVIYAISDTYGVISGAATIMTSVFIVISFLELPLMKQLGIGLGCAVILDATVVRCILLPASVVMLGELNWYLPKSFKRVFESGKALLKKYR